MVHRVQVREISNDEGNRLLRIVRRSSGSVVTWRRAQMVLLSAQAMDPAGIAKVTFTLPPGSGRAAQLHTEARRTNPKSPTRQYWTAWSSGRLPYEHRGRC